MRYSLATFILILIVGFEGRTQVNLDKIDSIVQHAVANELFEGSVLLADSGNILYDKSFGFAGKEAVQPIDQSTKFGIASITKMFTAIVILQMVEEGKFQLEDKLSAVIPELDIPKSNKISVHHLLLHISGLPNESDGIYAQPKGPEEFVKETTSNKLNRLGKFNYTNIDYVILGLIIEKYDKISWDQSVKTRILEKVSMTNTGFLALGKYPSNFAYTSSYNEAGGKVPDPQFYIENFYSAACMYSTAEDLLKLDQALYGDTLLSEKSKTLMYTSYPEYNYTGYSVWTYNYPYAASKPRIMERRGGIMGSNSTVLRLIDANKTLVILSTNNKFNPDSFGSVKSLKEALIIEVAESIQ